MAVQVIRATRPVAAATAPGAKKIKVAAYCRVSTDMEEQESSYEIQCKHYEDFINANPAWELAGIYADEGISGTSTKRREQFKKMIKDCEDGKIDMVITKSISRFARNTVDCLNYIRKLKDLDIPIFFEKENINTLDAKGEVMITIMASIAQQESQSISQNVRLGLQFKMQNGKGGLNTTQFLGYTKDREKDCIVIVPEEAETVRRIYREYLEGKSPNLIARRLTDDGIKTPCGKDKWFASTIQSILENEKYCGDLLLQKYYVTSCLTHEIKKNDGRFPQYYVEDDHDPIIPKDVYYQVQGELMRRGALSKDPTKIRYGSQDAFARRLYCGRCGRVLKKYTLTDGSIEWRCRKRDYQKKSSEKEVSNRCGLRNVKESELMDVMIQAFNQLPQHRDELLKDQASIWNGEIKRIDALIGKSKDQQRTMEERKAALENDDAVDHSSEIEFLEGQIKDQIQERNALIIERAEHADHELKIRFLLEIVDAMKEKWDKSVGWYDEGGWKKEEVKDTPACRDYKDFFQSTRFELPEGLLDERGRVARFDNELVVRYVDRVIVQDNGYDVVFKAGITVKVR